MAVQHDAKSTKTVVCVEKTKDKSQEKMRKS
jgi:hypothetical protein